MLHKRERWGADKLTVLRAANLPFPGWLFFYRSLGEDESLQQEGGFRLADCMKVVAS